jgi:glyoxylase-like metal-dependent hydrolase (beta-lactamase superfamily II)
MAAQAELLRFPLGPFQANAYLLVGASGKRAAVIDPGLEVAPLLQALRERGLAADWILDTHGHLDHTAGNAALKRATGAPLAIHADDVIWLERLQAQGAAFGFPVEDSPPPDVVLSDGQVLPFDGMTIEVLHTPGHSPGSVCFRVGDLLLVGDTLFRGSVGRTDLPGGSWEALLRSVRERLFVLPDALPCWPGHGPETTLGEERRSNPFVSDAALAGGAR